ncbi:MULTISPECIES: manganese efflux pump [Sporomusa]|jgi:putative sporulation protein YtaF|uniref:Manganese efflux pump MntP n=2 Tax=Sporomusa TaxID=2375 RepID=A0ABP2C400_9FIRM|nr:MULTISPECIES: manganese efflux pump [Sporomusa]MCM0759757.1 manganese efflux pump [Sporomusa sphaeroides DSM 2875]OLS56512.1 manganese efflux pump MntP [Sporomusa sphaeroides DSM 2875]CVK18607.1 manganese efflux pump MntP [Sporomusa sphaeroides DSM 2875]SCM82232.1 putative sporulation protein YtaF [uncultured Sporomusa sp.]HML35581.1 manganese efflux pump [Sporomusa sphaeroides]
MSIFYVLLLGLAVSIDGFVAGVAYGLKNIRMPLISLIIVGIVASICTAVAMVMAYMVGQFINTDIALILGALLLILLGLWSLGQQYFTKSVTSYEMDGEVTARKLTFSFGRLVVSIMAKPETADVDRLGFISSLEAVFLGLAVGADAMVGTFAVALMGSLPLYTPIVIGLIHMICIAGGCYSSRKFFPENLKKRFPYLPGTLLIILGLLRLG